VEQRLQSGLSLLQGHFRLEAAEDFHPAEAVVVQALKIRARQLVLHGHRNADLRRAAGLDSVESRWADTDDRQRSPIDHDLFSDDASIPTEPRAPIPVAEDRQRMPALNQIVGCSEHPTGGGADTEDGKIVSRYEVGPDQFSAALIRGAHGARV